MSETIIIPPVPPKDREVDQFGVPPLPKFKIIKHELYEKGKLSHTHYTIKRKKKFLGLFNYYSTITRTIMSPEVGLYKIYNKFETLEEANEYVKKLNIGKNIEGWTKSVAIEII